MEANWKLFLENHIDGYHLWHLHSKTVVGYDHAQQDWTACGRHWMFYEPELVKGEMPERRLMKLPVIPGIDASRFGSSVFMLFPNIGGVGGTTFFAFFVVHPIAPNRTRVAFRTFIKPLVAQDFVDDPELQGWLEKSGSGSLFGSSPPGGNSFSEKLELAGLSGDFVTEDKLAVESIQRAMSSQQFSVGPMAKDFEAAIEFYHGSILNFVKPQSTSIETA
jgi:phenylpropionate dioxygenase-like ring-hydroxylating dioxygenase large terminal subunit